MFPITDLSVNFLQRYLSNRVEREEAGTPGIIGDIRIGLAFRLKQLVGL
jgi:selenocysteine lyase/cysteine desulfurase